MYTIVTIIQELLRSCGNENAFLALNLKSILFNLNSNTWRSSLLLRTSQQVKVEVDNQGEACGARDRNALSLGDVRVQSHSICLERGVFSDQGGVYSVIEWVLILNLIFFFLGNKSIEVGSSAVLRLREAYIFTVLSYNLDRKCWWTYLTGRT